MRWNQSYLYKSYLDNRFHKVKVGDNKASDLLDLKRATPGIFSWTFALKVKPLKVYINDFPHYNPYKKIYMLVKPLYLTQQKL